MKQGEGEQKKVLDVYKRAFEESFVDNYDEWLSVMEEVNLLIAKVGMLETKSYKPYSYDAFCKVCKVVIDQHLDGSNWPTIIEEIRVKSKKSASGESMAREHMKLMESIILKRSLCAGIKSKVGVRLYKKYSLLGDKSEQKTCIIL